MYFSLFSKMYVGSYYVDIAHLWNRFDVWGDKFMHHLLTEI